MRRLFIGLMMALTGLMAASVSYAADDPTAALPAVLAAAKAPCTLVASRFIVAGKLTDGTKANAKFYEAACKEGLGYIVIAPQDSTPPKTFDCLSANAQAKELAAKGTPTVLTCILPQNQNATSALQPAITQLGQPCTIVKSRGLGPSATKQFFELACDSGAGYILALPRVVGAAQPEAYNCLDLPPGNIKCELTSTDAYVAAETAKLITASGKACTIKDKRYVGTASDLSQFFEVACDNGKGYMLQVAQNGDLKSTTGCVAATGLLGGCTLTDVRQALTEDNALYSSLAKKAGFDCAVSKYGLFPADGKNDVVELVCSNRPDGGVGVFPIKGGKPMVYDCLRAENQGFRCTFTKPDAVTYARLSSQLVAKGKGSCVVNGARSFGANDTSDFVEVSCADGGLGWVIEYPLQGQTPTDLLNCAQAANISSGGCELPTNKKK